MTGLGTDQFANAIEGIANIAAFMGENLERGDIESWKADRFRTWHAMELGNRYFVLQNSKGDMTTTPFEEGVDPEGKLAQMAGDKWVHTEDNKVQYFRLGAKDDGKPRSVTRLTLNSALCHDAFGPQIHIYQASRIQNWRPG